MYSAHVWCVPSVTAVWEKALFFSGFVHTCIYLWVTCLAVLFSCSFVSDSLQPHGLQHSSLPCPLSSPEACSNSCPLSLWCHPTSSSSVVPFTSCLQSFPASWSFLMSWLFTSGGQSIGASASASVLPVNIQGWFPLGLIGLISLQSKGLFKSLLQHRSWKASILQHSAFGAHIHTWLLEQPWLWLYGPLSAK